MINRRRRLPAVIIVTLWVLSGVPNLTACEVCYASHSGTGPVVYHACCQQAEQCCQSHQTGQTVGSDKRHSASCICGGQQPERSDATLPATAGEARSNAWHHAEALAAPAPSYPAFPAERAREEPPPPGFMVLVTTSTTSRSPPIA